MNPVLLEKLSLATRLTVYCWKLETSPHWATLFSWGPWCDTGREKWVLSALIFSSMSSTESVGFSSSSSVFFSVFSGCSYWDRWKFTVWRGVQNDASWRGKEIFVCLWKCWMFWMKVCEKEQFKELMHSLHFCLCCKIPVWLRETKVLYPKKEGYKQDLGF